MKTSGKPGYQPRRALCWRWLFTVLLLGLPGGTAVGETPSGNAPDTKSKLYDLSLDQLLDVQFDTVYSASRRAQKTWQAPASVSIITREDIQAFGYRTLGEALRSAPGVYTTEDRYYAYLGIRGFSRPGDYNSRALLLIDGLRANDNLYDSALVGQESLIEIDDIERVEIIRGPSSSLYGSSAFFGVINVVSRKGRDIRGVEASVEGGSLDTYKGRLTAGHQFESGLEAYVSGSFYDSRGEDRLYYAEFDAPESNNGIAEDLDYERVWHFLTTLTYRDFTLSSGFNYRTRGIPNAGFGTVFNHPRSQTWDRAGYLDLKYERDLPADVHVQGRIGYHHYDYRGVYPYDYADPGDPPDLVLNKDEADGDWWGVEILGNKPFWDERLTLTAGLEVRHNVRQEQLNYDDVSPPDYYVKERKDSLVLGVFTQADYAPVTNLIFSAGLRYDSYSTSGDTVNPRFGVMYKPWDPTTFKLLYGRAFRAPNAFETDYVAPGYAANKDLKAETIQTVEAVWEQMVRDPIHTSASVFYYDVQDLISYDYSGAFIQFRNLDSARAYGTELSAEGRWTNGWMARISYTAQRAEDGDTGDELSNAPRHLAKFHLRVPIVRDRISAGFELLYGGSVAAVQRGRVDDFWLANLTLFSKEIVKGVELSGSIYNLFDREYSVTGGDEHIQRTLPQNGRTFRIKLTYHF